ncbi:MAG: hypothetical protein MZV64_13495 [Ignavibacteriales bacterium]|nr:hypothetical protein [Ignavibacteriales bacterium]
MGKSTVPRGHDVAAALRTRPRRGPPPRGPPARACRSVPRSAQVRAGRRAGASLLSISSVEGAESRTSNRSGNGGRRRLRRRRRRRAAAAAPPNSSDQARARGRASAAASPRCHGHRCRSASGRPGCRAGSRSASTTDRKPAGYRSSMSSPLNGQVELRGPQPREADAPAEPRRARRRSSPCTSSNRTLLPANVTRPLMRVDGVRQPQVAQPAAGDDARCRSSWGFSIVPVKSAVTSARPDAADVAAGTPGGCRGSRRRRPAGPAMPCVDVDVAADAPSSRVLAGRACSRPTRTMPCSSAGVDRAVVAQAGSRTACRSRLSTLHPGRRCCRGWPACR